METLKIRTGRRSGPRRRGLAALAATVVAASALTLSGQTAAHASGYCNGTVITQHDEGGYSVRLIRSGGSICVNTWNQTGGRAWTVAGLDDVNHNPLLPHDEGYYYQYASTGFAPIPGHCVWYGAVNRNPQQRGSYVFYEYCGF